MILLKQFLEQPILPEIMQALALGLIAVMIAVTIFLVEKGSIFAFDRIVILKKVIQGKLFLLFLSFLFMPLFFWDLSGTFVRLVLLVLYFIGVAGILITLFRSYKWVEEIETEDKRIHEGYRQKKRLEYLEEISDEPQKLLAWEYIWQLKNKTGEEEITYIEKFIETIDSFLKRENETSAVKYISSFERSVNSITIRDWVIFENIFRSLLDWHYKVFLSEESYKAKKRYKHLIIILERLIGDFIKKGLSSGNSYIFLEILQVFVSEKEYSSNNVKYIKHLFAFIAPTFLDNVTESPETHTIWSSYFPQEWKITRQTIEDKQNLMAKLWLDYFINWAKQRIWKHYSNNTETKLDKQLEEVTAGLFPSVDPITWAIILTFLMRPWSDGERIKDLVEIPRKFGLVSRVHVMWGDDENKFFEQMKKERNNAIELALILFSSEFSREKLQGYISDLKKLSYEEGSRKTKNKNQIQKIFDDMISCLP